MAVKYLENPQVTWVYRITLPLLRSLLLSERGVEGSVEPYLLLTGDAIQRARCQTLLIPELREGCRVVDSTSEKDDHTVDDFPQLN